MESAVVDLKAELEKKKVLLNAQKLSQTDVNEKKLFKVKQPTVISSVKLKVQKEETDDEEVKMLEKSRTMLEKKAAMYDEIKNGCDVLENDEINEKFLINFQKKIEDSVSEERHKSEKLKLKREEGIADEEGWVEYVDALGRTRRCLQEDLAYMKARDRENMPEPPKPDAMQLEKEKLHDKWNKIEEESKDKRNLNYQDILFDEARQHGVGYMKFSLNEAERATQWEMLNKLREESKIADVNSKAERKQASKRLADRLAKVRQRKRLKLGLPIKDLYEEKLATPPSSDDETTEAPPPEPTRSTIQSEPTTVREWDVGKSTSVMDQKEWVDSRRKLREGEFAPPSSYKY